jgi:predicted anti-sigma-YlaC factor YlaD
MTCHELDERLDDWLDGQLAASESEAVRSHLAGCPACRERERELRTLLAHAAALPRSLTPPRDLWPGISERIERGSFWSALLHSWHAPALAAAAAALVAVAAWVWTGAGPEAVRTVAMPASPPAALHEASLTGISDPVLAAAAHEYEAAAKTLLEALQRRSGALAPEDLARVEANLEVIDRALEEVRQALVKDPANPELNRMLVATHRKKVDVLRRVVRLSTAL